MKIVDKFISRLKLMLENINTIKNSTNIDKQAIVRGSSVGDNVVVRENANVLFSNLHGVVLVDKNVLIKNTTINGDVKIGEYCRLSSCDILGNVNMGRYTSLWGPNLDLRSVVGNITIGNFCSIARNVSFQSFNHNHKKATTYFMGQNYFKESWDNEKVSNGNIVLENDVWIGTQSVILGGVTIHNGAVVAANSVVTKDVPAYSIVAGSPAKVIGYRFEQRAINELLEKQWWNWSDEEIKKNKMFFEKELE